MKRVFEISMMMVALAGCDKKGGGISADGGTTDMAMAVVTPDMTVVEQKAPTGAACTKSAECAGTTAACVKNTTGANGSVMWDKGYCTSKCSAQNNDPDNGVNPKCPGDNATCDNNSTCKVLCASVDDCRENYVCANVGAGGSICYPIAASGCDPDGDPRPANKKCMNAQKCTSFSPDSSYGECADVCNPLYQNCTQPDQGQNTCMHDSKDKTAMGTCIAVSDTKQEGETCKYLNDCVPGLFCNGGKCRKYCTTMVPDGGLPDGGVSGSCPNGQTCKQIKNATFSPALLGGCAP